MTSSEDPSQTLPGDNVTTPDDGDKTRDAGAAACDPYETVAPENDPSTVPESVGPVDPRRIEPRTFGDYELIEVIAKGGMGVVYKARQRNLNRTVALKMILSGQFANEDEIVRFRSEAEAAAGLDHPGIVPVYEVGQQQGQHFFSMGFVEGKSLAGRISESPLSSRDAAEMLLSIVDAVEYAHQRGIVHRDLKPANVLLKVAQGSTAGMSKSGSTSTSRSVTSSGARSTNVESRPMITDFGLAKRLESDSNLTASGQILGTPSYMPPEQAKGLIDKVGVQSDVYAIGAILYSMLTGRPPFHAATMIETIRHVCEIDPVPPRQINPEISRDLETICLKCLEKDPSRRYATAGDLGEELQAFLDGRPVKSRPIGTVGKLSRWASRKPGIASLSAAVILVTIAGVGGIVWQWRVAQSNFTTSQRYLGEARANLARAEEAQRIADEQRDKAEVSFDLARSTVKRFLTVVPNHELLNSPGMEPVKKDLRTLGRDHYLTLAEARPDDSQVQRGLAEARFFLAMTLEDIGQLPDAAGEYVEAVKLFKQLSDAAPESIELRRNLAACYGNLANVQINIGKRAEGITTYRRIRDMQQKLLDSHPDDSITEAHLAMTYLNLALLELDDHQIDPAMESAVTASQMAVRLRGEHPDDKQVQFALAKARSLIGRLHWERQERVEALSEYRLAVDEFEGMLQRNPEDPQLHAEFSEVLNDMASIHTELGAMEAAEKRWDQCIQHATTAHDTAPKVRMFHNNLSVKHRNRGIFYRNVGQFERAKEGLLTSRELKSDDASWLYFTAADLAVVPLMIDQNAKKLPEQELAKRVPYANQAIQWLGEAIDKGFRDVEKLNNDEALGGIRELPAFAELLTRIKDAQDDPATPR